MASNIVYESWRRSLASELGFAAAEPTVLVGGADQPRCWQLLHGIAGSIPWDAALNRGPQGVAEANVTHEGAAMHLVGVFGGIRIYPLWTHHANTAELLVFHWDVRQSRVHGWSGSGLMGTAAAYLQYLLGAHVRTEGGEEGHLEDIDATLPLAVLCSDTEGILPHPSEATTHAVDALKLPELIAGGRAWACFPFDPMTGEGIQRALSWATTTIARRRSDAAAARAAAERKVVKTGMIY